MHELNGLIYTIGGILVALLTWYQSSKKSDRDYIEQANERLNKENEQLAQKVEELRKELDEERKEKKNDN